MGSKLNPGHFDCYANALPDEPMFILLARDPSAPDLVDAWATERQRQIHKGHRPQSDQAMVDEAVQCAANMRHWRVVNNGAWRRPERAAFDELAAGAIDAGPGLISRMIAALEDAIGKPWTPAKQERAAALLAELQAWQVPDDRPAPRSRPVSEAARAAISSAAAEPEPEPDRRISRRRPTGHVFECPFCGGDLATAGHEPTCSKPAE